MTTSREKTFALPIQVTMEGIRENWKKRFPKIRKRMETIPSILGDFENEINRKFPKNTEEASEFLQKEADKFERNIFFKVLTLFSEGVEDKEIDEFVSQGINEEMISIMITQSINKFEKM